MQESQEMWVRSLCWEDLLKEEMETLSSLLAGIPWTEELGRLHSPWGHKEWDTTEWLSMHTHKHSIIYVYIYLCILYI